MCSLLFIFFSNHYLLFLFVLHSFHLPYLFRFFITLLFFPTKTSFSLFLTPSGSLKTLSFSHFLSSLSSSPLMAPKAKKSSYILSSNAFQLTCWSGVVRLMGPPPLIYQLKESHSHGWICKFFKLFLIFKFLFDLLFWCVFGHVNAGSCLHMRALTRIRETLSKGLTLPIFTSFSIVSLLYAILTPIFLSFLHLSITASFFLSLFLHQKHHFSSFSLESII